MFLILPCICGWRRFQPQRSPLEPRRLQIRANHSPAVPGDWQVSCVRHALANRSAFTLIQNTDWARMNYRVCKFTVCLSLKKKKKGGGPHISNTGPKGIHKEVCTDPRTSSRRHDSLRQKSWSNSHLLIADCKINSGLANSRTPWGH